MIYKLISLFCFTILFSTTSAQTVLQGTITDSNTKRSLPYVNIGIENKNIGTSSLNDGSFSIVIPTENSNDTLTFSMVGYFPLSILIKNIIATNKKAFFLAKKTIELNMVTITTKYLIKKKFGIKNEKALVHFTDGSTNQDDIFEIAQLIKFDTVPAKITSVNLLINQPRKDSATFRINFYQINNNIPTKRIIEKSIIQTKQIKKGWLKFDLSKFNINLKGNFFVAIEFIPPSQKTGPIYYEVKLGGSAKSYVRTSSQGLWKRPPHHYKMYVTALIENKKSNKHQEFEIDDDLETIPTKTIFSNSINDKFSIYVKLPEKYNSKNTKGYNVVYLLDGNAYFDIIADEVKKQKKEVILVGIGYENAFLMDSLRNRDYTFPHSSGQDSLSISGGAPLFLNFIRTELIPSIDKTYRTESNNRTLMGHSLGGYFTIFAMEQGLLNSNNLFSYYVSASPSLYYGNQFLIKTLQNITPNNLSFQKLLLTVGEDELKEDATTPENYNSFIRVTNDRKFKGIKLTTKIFPKFGHMDTAVPTFINALKEIK